MARPNVTAFFDNATHTITYVVACPQTGVCAVIDPVMNFDLVSGKLSTKGIGTIIEFMRENHYVCHWILETHIHADHITAAAYLQDAIQKDSLQKSSLQENAIPDQQNPTPQNTPPQIGIAADIATVYRTFSDVFNLDPNASLQNHFDQFLNDNDQLPLGDLTIKVIATPGHTPACLSFHIGDAVFVGDTIFMPDFGSARCDFPSGSATQLYHSIQKLLTLPDTTRMFVGHDYGTANRNEIAWETTVAAQRASNIHIAGKSLDEFVQAREARDAELGLPKLMYPAINLNLGAGKLPEAEQNGRHYLKIPIRISEER